MSHAQAPQAQVPLAGTSAIDPALRHSLLADCQAIGIGIATNRRPGRYAAH